MSCCGKMRQSISDLGVARSRSALHGPVLFEYIGRASLITFGRATDARYRFDHNGSRVYVDPRDAPALALVANLRRAG